MSVAAESGSADPARSTISRRRAAFHAVGRLVSADLLIGDLDRSGSIPLHTQIYTGRV
jgi:hypothetical protein